MASSLPPPPLDPYIDIPFNQWLILILILTYACAIRSRGLLLLVVFAVSTIIIIFDTTSSTGEMIKIMAELPLGLGSVLAFFVASRSFQNRHLSAFTIYVNLAVYGNIGMMVATPAGGTFRGWCTKFACMALFIWIVLQGYHARWKTILLHQNNLFVFTAVSKYWIFAHAVYRFVLLTLPCFGSGRRHRLLEVYSLSMTFALSTTAKLPFEHGFGMADTLVVPANAAWSAIATTFDLIPRNKATRHDFVGTGTSADMCLGAMALGVAVFACSQILSEYRQGRGRSV